jgi:heat shock protein HslJ
MLRIKKLPHARRDKPLKWLIVSCLGLLAALVLTFGSPAQAACELVNTYWQAVEIDGSPVAAAPSQREPHLLFHHQGRVTGSTGCNRFTGSYQQEGKGLRFTPLAVTKMACPPPLDALERSFLQAIAVIAAMQQSGNTLELLDSAGQVRLRLQAR